MKRAAGLWIGRAWLGNCRQKVLLAAMHGSVENLVARGQFDDPPKEHCGHPIADVFDHREIMGNEQQGNRLFHRANLSGG